MKGIVETLQDSIGSIDFWQNADKQKKALNLKLKSYRFVKLRGGSDWWQRS